MIMTKMMNINIYDRPKLNLIVPLDKDWDWPQLPNDKRLVKKKKKIYYDIPKNWKFFLAKCHLHIFSIQRVTRRVAPFL